MSFLKKLQTKNKVTSSITLEQDRLYIPGEDRYTTPATEDLKINPLKIVINTIVGKVVRTVYNRVIREKVNDLHSPQFTSAMNIQYLIRKFKSLKGGNKYDFEVGQIPGKGFVNYFIYQGKQLTDEESILNAYKQAIADINKLEDAVVAFIKDLHAVKFPVDKFEGETKEDIQKFAEAYILPELVKLINKHLPQQYRDAFTPKQALVEYTKIPGCNNVDALVRPGVLSCGVFGRINKQLTDVLEDNAASSLGEKVGGTKLITLIKPIIQDVWFTAINQYFAFVSKVAEWGKRSVVRQKRKKGNSEVHLTSTESLTSLIDSLNNQYRLDSQYSVSEESLASSVLTFLKLRKEGKHGKYKFNAPKEFKEGNTVSIKYDKYSTPFQYGRDKPDPILTIASYCKSLDKHIASIVKIDSDWDKVTKKVSSLKLKNINSVSEATKEINQAIKQQYGDTVTEVYSAIAKLDRGVNINSGSVDITLKSKETYTTAIDNINQFKRKHKNTINKFNDFIDSGVYDNSDFLTFFNNNEIGGEEVWDLSDGSLLGKVISIMSFIEQLNDLFTGFLPKYIETTGLDKVGVSLESISLEDEEETDSTEDVEDDNESAEVDQEATDSDVDTDQTEETSDEGADSDTEETTEETTEGDETDEEGDEETPTEDHEFFRTDAEEPEFNQPDEEKVLIKAYLEPLIGDGISELRLYTAGEVNRPLYHISMNPNIASFTPKISRRTLTQEDRSLPRISTSTSLIGCLNGYQSMVSDMEGRETKNFSGMFKVYELPYQYAIKPSQRLLTDVEKSDEYWLISWKKETYRTIPTMVADFTIPKIENVYGNNGVDKTFHLYIKVTNGTLYLDHERKLNPGCYHVVLNGYNFKYPLRNNQLIQVDAITENEYNRVTALSMMIKKR